MKLGFGAEWWAQQITTATPELRARLVARLIEQTRLEEALACERALVLDAPGAGETIDARIRLHRQRLRRTRGGRRAHS